MLQISHISKKYVTGELVQVALNDVSLGLRDNEFVAILGPSGSGKTTLLNVIGGLDRYDSGDLIINGISTRQYTDRDWDSYRNHTIGFVFQSYNLIPHQTILSNVELALTISGIGRQERKQRATEALKKVGLGDQLHKRPNQLSGGQMQRVAIARALVNNPDILLADEPTGALDSQTSIQVMDLLKEVSHDRLVVMVTHNPELAETYANRIVQLKDGRITADSNPVTLTESGGHHENMGRSSMGVWTALSLSFNNLKTKLGRTLLTSFAGSIGIIGIALILSLSAGFQNYVDKIQEDTLSSYPLTIEKETTDSASMAASLMAEAEVSEDVGERIVEEKQMMTQMFAQIGSNDLGAFKAYMEDHNDEIGETINAVKYDYGISPQIYWADTSERITKVNPGNLFTSMVNSSMMETAMTGMNTFQVMIDNQELLDSQYDILGGHWPEAYDEMVLVLSDPHAMSDYMSYALGIRDPGELTGIMQDVMDGKKVTVDNDSIDFSYDDLLNLKYKLVLSPDLYRYNSEYGVYEDMSEDEAYMKELIKNGTDLKIVGVVCPKENASATALSTGVAYTPELIDHIRQYAADSEIVKKQLADRKVDVFTNTSFAEENRQEREGINFEDMISVDTGLIQEAFGGNTEGIDMESMMQDYMAEMEETMAANVAETREAMYDTMTGMLGDMLRRYIKENAEPGSEEVVILDINEITDMVETYFEDPAVREEFKKFMDTYLIPNEIYESTLVGIYEGALKAVAELVPDGKIALNEKVIQQLIIQVRNNEIIAEVINGIAVAMAQEQMQQQAMEQIDVLMEKIMADYGSTFTIDTAKLASAFQFNMDEDELRRLINAVSGNTKERTADLNLTSLGYADMDDPESIAIYLVDFDGKERFVDFLDDYNNQMKEKGQDEMVINYTDMTGVLMSSVKIVVDSVSYVLIAFVSISLVVSSIMIGIITYISVLERTKEIGILRAIGASKRNISLVFNAETFIIGLCAGLMGIVITLLLLPPINFVIHKVTGNTSINAVLPAVAAVVLVILSVILTFIGGLIPARKAAKQDPVIALRTE